MAARSLCIPETSAPSEHDFSVAGLQIAKDSARLASDTANELIFLHDAMGFKNILKHNTFEASSSKRRRGRGRAFFAGHWQLFSK